MKKKLKICLAMGGGVSLGSFSGSALIESLKLLTLYGRDSNGNEYDEVIVDGMSGASAGAIALTIMLKSLIDYKSSLKTLNTIFETKVTEEDIVKELEKLYFNSYEEAVKHPKIEELKALQVAQKVQEEIWVKQLKANDLFGNRTTNNFKPNIHDSFGLLERKFLEKLAKQFIIDSKFDNLENIKVLDKNRVPFACSLTNLLPLEIQRNESKLSKFERNVLQSTGSQNHTEVRVIDFVFKQNNNKPTDKRWFKFGTETNPKKLKHNLNSPEAWSIICSSALACGAFPFAFEPIILKRYKREFDGESNINNQWPVVFNNLHEKFNQLKTNQSKGFSVFNEEDDNEISYDSFNFPYVDGGAFNNEPIKEAYRIGAFQDFTANKEEFDRMVLFVDPIVRTSKYKSFNLASLQSVKNKKKRFSKVRKIVAPKRKNDKNAKPNGEFNKAIGVTQSLVGSLLNQGRIKEENKIFDVEQNLQLRNTVFKYIEDSNHLGNHLTMDLLLTAYNKVKTNLHDNIISIGTRDPIKYFNNEIRKVCTNEKKFENSSFIILRPDFYELIDKIGTKDSEKNTNDLKPKHYNLLGLDTNLKIELFAKTVFKIIFDFSLNTDGKNEDAERLAIIPLNDKEAVTSLPGEEISAFGGFTSEKARQYAFEYGKLCALKSLAKKPDDHPNIDGDYGFRKKTNDTGTKKFPFIEVSNQEQLEDTLLNKIKDIDFYKNIKNYEKEIKNGLIKNGLNRLLQITKSLFSFLNFAAASIIAIAASAIRLVSLQKKWFVTLLSYIIRKLFIKGDLVSYKKLDSVTVSLLSSRKLNSKVKITTKKNSTIKVKSHINKITNAKGETVYQYLFEAYKADTMKSSNELEFLTQSKIRNKKSNIKITSAEKTRKSELSMNAKINIPTNFDKNIDVDKYNKELEKNYDKIITSIVIGGKLTDPINEALSDETKMLSYSFKSLDSHVNPMLEFDFDNKDKGWYLKENTTAMYKILLKKQLKP